jgi:eukaryotic-like serine/threonine-protein kinase
MKSVEPIQENKEILGYVLKKRIGAGGFGEVWSAIAPGGLQKALKIVYGYHDDRRAQSELKALDRVKAVRHPFLLSLERIEVFEGQLIVVTELADKSLADVYNEFQAKGEPGVPREMLLKFIRSSADALDYLSNEHGLQHLDVKPENLLIVGGHVKVADFGLAKEINNVAQSMISGMTPLYAAPEVFDGRPGKYSDQYSLAVVYQEMLTGQRPFAGETTAQLAVQHIHGKPNLRSLPASDQPIIAKALAKDPSLRFSSCRDLAEELSNVKRATRTVVRRMQPAERHNNDTQKTVILADSDITKTVSSDALPLQKKEIRLLAPPECQEVQAVARPVLVIGVGASANRAVSLLKRQLIARHGAMQQLPAIRLLCIDTDRNDITRLCMADDDSALTTAETLPVPLMKPEYYRDKTATRLSWLSRRWIFNIPRSLQTEGLRPLGRLAFSEHFEAICERLETALKTICQPEALAQTAETLAMNPGALHPRIYVVSSISGGCGSGMTLDLAYTLRLLLAEQGFDLDAYELVGLLLHGTYQRNRDPGLSVANAFAFMTELRHFIESGYPGDKTIGMPEFGKVSPFEFTYFNELGDDLSQSEFERQLVNTAEYIYLATMSKCSVFFSGCRAIEQDQTHFSFRTFGLSASGPESLATRTESVYKIAMTMVQRWMKGRPEIEFDANKFIDGHLSQFELQPEAVVGRVTLESNQVFPKDYLCMVKDAVEVVISAKTGWEEALIEFFDRCWGFVDKNNLSRKHESDPVGCLELNERICSGAQKVGEQLVRQILNRMNPQNLDLSAAKALEKGWVSKLEWLLSEINRRSDQVKEKIEITRTLLRQISREKAILNQPEKEKLNQAIGHFTQLRYQELLLRFARRYYREVISTLSTVKAVLNHFERSLNELHHVFQSKMTSLSVTGSTQRTKMEELLVEGIEKGLPAQIAQTEIQIYQNLAAELGGFVELFNRSSMVSQLPGEIVKAAQKVLADAYQKSSLENALDEHGIGMEQVAKWIGEQIYLAQPRIRDCGGALRAMLGLPALTDQSILPDLIQNHLDVKLKAVKGTRGSLVFCFEGEDVALANLAFRLLQIRPDAVDLVKRIHTRSDISWSSLVDLF